MPGSGWNAHLEEREPERRVTITASSGSKWGHVNSNAQCAESQQPSAHTGPPPATSLAERQSVESLGICCGSSPHPTPVAMQLLTPPSVAFSPWLLLGLCRWQAGVVLLTSTWSPGVQSSHKPWKFSPFPLPFSL